MITSFGSQASDLAVGVKDAARRIRGNIVHTPVVRLPWLDTPTREVWGKLECWQHTGAFKIRGAYNALLQLEPGTSVITASAGNHGLSVATAATQLGLSCSICVPVNASELKVRRLSDTGARVIPVGRDLFAAAKYAIGEANRTGAYYVSAYSDRSVIAGQGTCIVEACDDAGPFDTVLIPLGGGGLLAGVGSYLTYAAPQTQIIGVHPEIFGRKLQAAQLVAQLSRPVVPTLADGLAVQLEKESWVVPILEEITDAFVNVDEIMVKVGVYALLHNQGLLVEGAGAIGVGALLNDLDGQQITGKVLAILSGGNISSTQLAQAMSVAVTNNRLRTLLGLRATRTSLEIPQIRRNELSPAQAYNTDEHGDEGPYATPDTLQVWESLVAEAVRDIDKLKADVRDHRNYLSTLGLRADETIFHTIHHQFQLARRLAEVCQADQHQTFWQLRGRYRLLLQQIALLRCGLQWCSPSYDQSLEVMFFDPAEQRTAGVNYARYGSVSLRNFELRLTNALGFNPEQVSLLATSSGQAAYQLIETFLMRNVVSPSDTVLYAPYIYFEAFEQMRSIPFLRHVVSPSYFVNDLIRVVEEYDAKVLFLDPLANLTGQPTIDLRDLANQVADRHWGDRWIVIDGTMVSGGVNPFEWFAGEHHPRILYYESGSKYLQMGLDLQMSGLCAAEVDLMPSLLRYRRNSGTIMYHTNVAQFPNYTRAQFIARMAVLSRNAGRLASILKSRSFPPGELQIGFPDHWSRLGWKHGGGIVTLSFSNPGLNNRDQLEALIETLLQECRMSGVAMTKGVSFGFSVTRVSAAAAMAESTDPFLRFAVGEETELEFEKLSIAIVRGISTFLDQGGRA